ncbi:MAG TPA: formyltransferase family protein [Anaeromyxobacteraceae bacterium]|nr:formyltransferase family protein [Anaeromyxobacteraceae bacterium]
MRFAITAVDRYLGVFEALVRAGWEPVKLFTVPARSKLDNQQAVLAFAEQKAIPIQLSRLTDRDMQDLRDRGCEALVVASYNWKVPAWEPYLKYAVNFHSSPLPYGRGPYPPVRAILDGWDHWGVTCHRLTAGFDGGDILASEEFPLGQDECHERLDLKIQMAAKRLATRIAGAFPELWHKARPQEQGSYFPKFKLWECVIDFDQPVEHILRHVRAYGAIESFAHVNHAWFVVRQAVGWTEAHEHSPGTVVHVFNQSVVVAAREGYVGLLDVSLAPANLSLEIEASRKTP